MVDRNPVVTAALQAQAGELGATGLEVVCADAMDWLADNRRAFDIVFLDPPFSKKPLGNIVARLLNCAALRQGSLLYVETDDDFRNEDRRLAKLKSSKAGTVYFMLFEYTERQA
jgi:16S rRNA G966 N2-methylase RsmD